MPDLRYQVLECTQPDCRLRFPRTPLDPPLARCPRCQGELLVAEEIWQSAAPYPPADPPALELHLLLDNLRSAWNAGSIFRSADGAGVRHIYTCGITPTPQHPRLAKTALGAEHTVAWSAHLNAVTLAEQLRKRGLRLWALEFNPQAQALFEVLPVAPGRPLVLVIGNEVSGVEPGLLRLCEQVVYLPMQGLKESLNVAVAAGIAMYALLYGSRSS